MGMHVKALINKLIYIIISEGKYKKRKMVKTNKMRLFKYFKAYTYILFIGV